jgi:predicted secreted Zn-dependent protease
MIILAGCGGLPPPRAPEGPFSAPHGLSVEAGEDTYDVRGTTIDEVRRAIDAGGPRIDGRRFVGRTRWDLAWRFTFALDARGCRIATASTRVALHTVYPRWTGAATAPAEVATRWAGFIDALRRHEETHRRHGLEAGAAVQRRLLQLLPQPDCTAAERVANRMAQGVVSQWREADRDYDVRTRHGATEGASLR